MAGRVLSGIALLALIIIDANSRRKVRRVHDEKRRVFEQALREAQSDAAAQQKLCDSAARELLVLIPAGDISRVSTYLDTALHKYAELDTLEREARELSLRCELLSAQQPQSDVPTDPPSVRLVPGQNCKARSTRSPSAAVRRKAPSITPPGAAAPPRMRRA